MSVFTYVWSSAKCVLQDKPVNLIHGPRQCGKATFERSMGDHGVLRASVKVDSIGFVTELPDKVVLEEAQQVPDFFYCA